MYSGSRHEVKEFIQSYTVEYTVVVAEDDIVYRFGVIGYPTYFLIDPEGNIVRKYVGDPPGLTERIKSDVAELKRKFWVRR